MNAMLDATTKNVDDFKSRIKEQIEADLQTIISKVARAKSDTDLKLAKQQAEISQQDQRLEAQGVSFSEMAGVIAMLIENVNMQLEAETTDLVDRRQISLFGCIPKPAQNILKTDVT
jgi:hypothetical protein